MTDVSRRLFLGGSLALATVAAMPAAIAAESVPVLYGDGVHDDADALQALFSGKPFKTVDGFEGIAVTGVLADSRHMLTRPLVVGIHQMSIHNCVFEVKGRLPYLIVLEPGAKAHFDSCMFNVECPPYNAAIYAADHDPELANATLDGTVPWHSSRLPIGSLAPDPDYTRPITRDMHFLPKKLT